jgi:hypothetical protein
MVQDELILPPWDWKGREGKGREGKGREGRDDLDMLMIPGANYLNPQWDFGHLATAIENFAKPVMIFGLGTEAQRELDDVVLKSGSVRLLQALAAHCTTLFLRGPFTAGVCARYGITNVVSAGCPSITLNPDPMLGVKIEEKIGQPLRRLASAGAANKGENQPVEQGLFALIAGHEGSSLVLQCPAEKIDLARGDHAVPGHAETLANARDFFAPEADPTDFAATFARVARSFSDADGWIQDLRRRDRSYTVNTRIHGTILSAAAVAAGLKDIPEMFRRRGPMAAKRCRRGACAIAACRGGHQGCETNGLHRPGRRLRRTAIAAAFRLNRPRPDHGAGSAAVR